MRVSHVAIASFGTLFLHATIAYALLMENMIIQKPAVNEIIVTNVVFIDAPKPAPKVEEPLPEVEEKKPEPIVKKEPPKIVKKVLKKPTPIKEPIKETVVEKSPIHEPMLEKTLTQSTPAKVEKSAPMPAAQQSDNALSLYLAKVRQKIQESLRYPSMAKKMGVEGEAMVQFLIRSNGTVEASSIKITKSSGKSILDRNAMAAVLDALPFELPPQEDLQIVIPVVFKLKS